MKLTTLFAVVGLLVVAQPLANAEFLSDKEKKAGLISLAVTGVITAGLYAKYVTKAVIPEERKEKNKQLGLTVGKTALGAFGLWQTWEGFDNAHEKYQKITKSPSFPVAGWKMTTCSNLARTAGCPLALTVLCFNSAWNSFNALRA